MNSFAEHIQVLCPRCQRTLDADIWLVVDASEQPELLERIHTHTLHAVNCPHCMHQAEVNAPLLLFRAGDTVPLVFSPAQETTPEEDKNHAAQLIGLLQGCLAENWKDEWLEQPLLKVDRHDLSSLIEPERDSGLGEEVNQLLSNIFSKSEDLAGLPPSARSRALIESLLSNDPTALQFDDFNDELFTELAEMIAEAEAGSDRLEQLRQLEAQLLEIRAHVQSDARSSPAEDPSLDLSQRLISLFNAGSWEQTCRIIKAHPEFLGEEADQLLETFIATTHEQGNSDAETLIREHRELLWLCRRLGLEAALKQMPPFFAEREAVLTAQPDSVPSEFLAEIHLISDAYRRFVGTSDPDALDEAIRGWERIVHHPAFTTVEPDFCINVLNDGGVTFLRRHMLKGKEDDLNIALNWTQKAVGLTPTDSPELPTRLINYGSVLSQFYDLKGDLTDLERAIKTWEKAVSLTPDDSPAISGYLNNLSIGLRKRYLATGLVIDLEESVRLAEQAVEASPPDWPELPNYLLSLGRSLQQLARRNGKLSFLERAVQSFNTAVNLSHPKSPNYLLFLNSLGHGLKDYYDRTSALAPLEQAVETWKKAKDASPPDAPLLASILNNLGSGLITLYERKKDANQLEHAIEAFEASVNLTPPAAPDLRIHLDNLATSLSVRYRHTHEVLDLERALELWHKVNSIMPKDSPDRARPLNNLANGLKARYDLTKDLAVLDESIKHYRMSLNVAPAGWPELPSYFNNLGLALQERYRRTGNNADLEQAREAYMTACEEGLKLDPKATLIAARGWGIEASQDQAWDEASKAYNYARQAMNKLLEMQVEHQNKELWLREMQGVSARGAYALAKVGDLENAVVALEHGLARLLAERLELNQKRLERLKEMGHADLLSKYRQAVGRLQELTRVEHPTNPQEGVKPVAPRLAEDARQELNATIDAIRNIRGYEDFLKGLSFHDIQRVASETPIAYLVATEVGGVALVINQKKEMKVNVCWLDGLTLPTLIEKVSNYLTYYNDWRNDLEDDARREKWFAVLEETTQWLWQEVMGSLIENLRPTQHAILVPANLLGLLPLHGAWGQDSTAANTRRYALDEMTFTYAPNARSLISVGLIAEQVRSESSLVIDEPLPVNSSGLPYSIHEARVAAAAFQHSRILRHEHATRDAVLKALTEYDVIHFSCHGNAYLDEPLESGLIMADDVRLTLRDWFNLRLENVRLTVVSACETGIPGLDLPDEMVNLPTGLLQAGVAGVIATLWAVFEVSTALLMARFYELWRTEDSTVFYALRQAQLWVRDTNNYDKREYFKQFIPELGGTKNEIPYETATALYQALVLQPSNERTYAHPYYWAAFSYWGV